MGTGMLSFRTGHGFLFTNSVYSGVSEQPLTACLLSTPPLSSVFLLSLACFVGTGAVFALRNGRMG